MRILVVDDHPMTVNGYLSALSKKNNDTFQPQFTKAYDCETAYTLILNAANNGQPFNLIIIDEGLPPYTAKGIKSGSDVALFLNKKMPYCKIIMITAHTEVLMIYNIAKNIHPDGLIIKNEITPDNLPLIVKEVLHGNQFQSPMVKSCIAEIWKKELMIEDYNRQILFYLSKGFKIKDIEQTMSISSSAIQKRIIKMKKAFDISDDSGLVKEAFRLGFI